MWGLTHHTGSGILTGFDAPTPHASIFPGARGLAVTLSGASAGSPPDIFAGGDESGALMRGIDWSASPLGPVEGWPRSLQAMIPAMLAKESP